MKNDCDKIFHQKNYVKKQVSEAAAQRCKFAAYFQNTFSQEQLWVTASAVWLKNEVVCNFCSGLIGSKFEVNLKLLNLQLSTFQHILITSR